MVVALSILAVLATIAIPSFQNLIRDSRLTKARSGGVQLPGLLA